MKQIFLILTLLLSIQFVQAQAGTLDSSFGGDGKVTADSFKIEVRSFAMQKDGKFIIAGSKYRNQYNKLAGDVIERFNQDGTVDESFGTGGFVLLDGYFGYQTIGVIFKVAIDQHDKIVICASFHPGSKGFHDIGLIRLNSDGTLDTKFNKTGYTITSLGYYHEEVDMIVQSDNNILVAGIVKNDDGNTQFHFLMRSLSSGKPDNTFGKQGIVRNYSSLIEINLVQKVDSKIILGGVVFPSALIQLERYNINGTIDSAFGTNGTARKSFQDFSQMTLESIAIQSDEKIIATGQFGATLGVTRFESNGKFDSTFSQRIGYYKYDPGDNGSSTAKTLFIDKNDKILVSGVFYWTIYTCKREDSCANALVIFRLSKNGNPDSAFGINGIGIADFSTESKRALTSASSGKAVMQKDDKVVVIGSYTSFGMARFNTKKQNASILFKSAGSKIINGFQIKLYPNPASNILHIEGLPVNTKTKLIIRDINGNVRMTATANAASFAWNISRLQKGSYVLRVEANDTVTNTTFIKE